MRRVKITGIGLISPLENKQGVFFSRLARGHPGIARLPTLLTERPSDPAIEHPQNHVGAAAFFEATSFISAPRLRMLDKVSQFALAFRSIDKRRAVDTRRVSLFLLKVIDTLYRASSTANRSAPAVEPISSSTEFGRRDFARCRITSQQIWYCAGYL